MAGKPGRPAKWLERNKGDIAARLNGGKALKVLDEVDSTIADYWTDITPAQVAALAERAKNARWKLDKILPTKSETVIDATIRINVGD